MRGWRQALDLPTLAFDFDKTVQIIGGGDKPQSRRPRKRCCSGGSGRSVYEKQNLNLAARMSGRKNCADAHMKTSDLQLLRKRSSRTASSSNSFEPPCASYTKESCSSSMPWTKDCVPSDSIVLLAAVYAFSFTEETVSSRRHCTEMDSPQRPTTSSCCGGNEPGGVDISWKQADAARQLHSCGRSGLCFSLFSNKSCTLQIAAGEDEQRFTVGSAVGGAVHA